MTLQMGTGLPEGLPRSGVDAAHRFYSEARGSAREELEKQRAIMAERENELKQEAANARQKENTLEQQLTPLQERARQAESEVDSLSALLTESRSDLKDTQESSQRLSTELARIRQDTARLVRQMRGEHRRREQKLMGERDQMAAARDRGIERSDDQQKAWPGKIDQTRQATRAAEAAAEQQAKVLRAERDRAIAERDEATQSLRDAQGQIQGVTTDLEHSRGDLSVAESALDKNVRRGDELDEKLENTQSERDSLREQLIQTKALADERKRLLDALGSGCKTGNKPKPKMPKE